MIVLSLTIAPNVRASPVTVDVAPPSQVVSEYGAVTYTITVSAPAFPGDDYSLSLSGYSGSEGLFSPNPVTVPGAGATSTLTIDAGANGLCPGTYSFTVTATHVQAGADSGTSASFSLTVTPAGPPLQATVTTDKPEYRLNDKVTIQMNVNKPAEAQLTVQPPSGSPKVYGPTEVYGPVSQTLTADTVGRWSATFEAGVCSEVSSAVAYFDVNPNTYDVSLSLSGVPTGISVTIQVDGQDQGTTQGSKVISFKVETSHTITVEQYVAGDAGVRYYCSQNSWSVSSADSHTFTYQTQYQFSVTTDPSGVTPTTGGGWYSDGTPVQTNQAPATVQGTSGTQYVFKDWELDGAAQSGNQLSVTMDKPHTAVAKYTTQYQLVIDSPGGIGDPQGAGYHDAGSTATFSVTSPVGFLVQQVFVRWEGDYTGSSPQGSVTMDGPKTVHAVWTTSYTQLYIAAGVAVIAVVAIIAAIYMTRRKRKGPAPEKKPMPSAAGVEAEGVKCASCGTENLAGEKFCTNCGEKLAKRGKHQT
jgi:hypothetical protein